MGREALAGLHPDGHSDTALSSRERKGRNASISTPFVDNNQAILFLIPCLSDLCPWRLGDEHPGSFQGETKTEVKAVPDRADTGSREGRAGGS